MEDSTASALPPLSTREVLRGLVTLVCPLICIAQVSIFFIFRWERVESQLLGGGSQVEWVLNPWVIWFAVLLLGMAFFGLWVSKPLQGRFRFWWVNWACAALAIGLGTVGLLMEPPATTIHRDPGNFLEEQPLDPWQFSTQPSWKYQLH